MLNSLDGPAVKRDRRPFAVELESGTSYLWCACGHSRAQPFCDGSHCGMLVTPLRFQVHRDGIVWLCGCKRSQQPPFCDGSHRR